MSESNTDAITLAAVGDLSLGDSPKMLGIGVRKATSLRGGAYLFARTDAVLRADLVFGNLEGVLSDTGFLPRSFERAQLRGHPFMATVLREAGFNVLSVANNHMMQYGPVPFQETCDLLQRAGIAVVGRRGDGDWQCAPVVLEVRGGKVGFLAYAEPDGHGHPPCYALLSRERVLADVQRLQSRVDTVVVSLHWGDEFVRSPSPGCRTFGRALIAAGARIVLGHHPHVIQEIERYRSGWICYSLGNFVSDMVWNPKTLEGLAVRFALTAEPAVAISKVTIGAGFAPLAEPMDPGLLLSYVREDVKRAFSEQGYRRLVRSRVRENRKLGYRYLFLKFYKYNPIVFSQIVARSLTGLLEGFTRILGYK